MLSKPERKPDISNEGLVGCGQPSVCNSKIISWSERKQGRFSGAGRVRADSRDIEGGSGRRLRRHDVANATETSDRDDDPERAGSHHRASVSRGTLDAVYDEHVGVFSD